jgi:hypothetical protein
VQTPLKGGFQMDKKLKKIHDVSTGYSYFVSEVFEEFLKEHFTEENVQKESTEY